MLSPDFFFPLATSSPDSRPTSCLFSGLSPHRLPIPENWGGPPLTLRNGCTRSFFPNLLMRAFFPRPRRLVELTPIYFAPSPRFLRATTIIFALNLLDIIYSDPSSLFLSGPTGFEGNAGLMMLFWRDVFSRGHSGISRLFFSPDLSRDFRTAPLYGEASAVPFREIP